ncbi:hypothetical protein [Mesorhizobium sp. 8]|uniref:hypothetical protein n=1 Tax=Mesorhizobium sp. 8 TaxID=2584466 RepID=UPI0011210795|nr:hypothetical protein [Mesorhizobium sp. 8]QDB99785.1 hypothetical protein FGU64_04820 [Mesorhizobium sp. 8]
MTLTFNEILRDFVTDGVPSSGAWRVQKKDFRAALNALQTGDASGLYDFIPASNTGAGTANALKATTAVALPATPNGALLAVNVYADNTASPVTVQFNGGTVYTIKTNSGNDVALGGLKAGMVAAGYISGMTFRLLSDQASAAIQAAAEAALAEFKSLYLGALADDAAATAAAGGAPVTGAEYWNTTVGKRRTYSGSVWEDTAVALNDGDVTEPKLAGALALSMAPVVADRAALKAVETSRYGNASLTGDAFEWNSGDVSSTVAPRSINATGSNLTDEFTAAGHRLRTGDPVILATAFGGLSVNTYYYAIRLDGSRFYLALSAANAYAGTLLSINADGAVTLKVVPDTVEGAIILRSGANKDGTGGAWLRRKKQPGNFYAADYGCVAGTTDCQALAINRAMDAAEEAGGGLVLLPPGFIRISDYELLMRRYVRLQGVDVDVTTLDVRPATTDPFHALNASWPDAGDVDSDGSFPYDRIIAAVSDLTVLGWNASSDSSTRGALLRNNQRSWPFMRRVKFSGLTDSGLILDGTNWNVGFEWVEFDVCGRLRSAATGIRVTAGSEALAGLYFSHVLVEGCGNSTSAGGGMDAPLSSANGNRGWYFTDCQFEGNFGTAEAHFVNVNGLNFVGMYHERVNATGNLIGFEIEDCTGHFTGGEFHPEAGSPTVGLKFVGASRFKVDSANFGSNYSQYAITAGNSSSIKVLNCGGATTNATELATIDVL